MDPFDLSLLGRQRSALDTYTRDLTAAALRDELEPVRCREAETDRVIAILLRQSKNNPVLVGEAGVGKTAIVEGLAQRLTSGNVPDALRRARVLAVSHIDLIAGTSYRGQFEKRLQAVIEQASRDPHVILFIDELHNLIGAGTGMGQPVDAANLLKPALSRGALRVIGATTRDEYDRYVRQDAALERRFHPVAVAELDSAQTLHVLQARRPRLEMHHGFAITDAALAQAITRSDASGEDADRRQPDKAIDLLDEACSLERLRHPRPLPPEVDALVADRARLLKDEREAMDELLGVVDERGTLLERFSFGTYRALEAMGIELERLVTGQVSSRPPVAQPDSVRRAQEQRQRTEGDPAQRLADTHFARLRTEDRLREALVTAGFVIDAEHVAAAR